METDRDMDSIQPWSWNLDDLKKLIGQQESSRLEFKRSMLMTQSRETIAKELSIAVSAFANTEGGTIVVGIVEREEGKAKIADSIDTGIEITKWSPEQL